MLEQDRSGELLESVAAAIDKEQPLSIVGSGSKSFYGEVVSGEPINTGEHSGVVHYDPSELVVQVRAGTRVVELEKKLAEHGQRLPFEPPVYSPESTIGGVIASGLSGPARPYSGAVRDHVLGVTCINGRGDLVVFGGQVMKNVAGYDVSRLMTGSLGILGLMLDISIKVLPLPEHEVTLVLSQTDNQAIELMNTLAGQPLPISGACHHDGLLRIRLSGASPAIAAATPSIGGDEDDDGESFWRRLRDQQLDFFTRATRLWRVSVAPASDAIALPDQLVDWGGGLRWLADPDVSEQEISDMAVGREGHASLFRDRAAEPGGSKFAPLDAVTMRLTRNLKSVFDPQGIFNRGRLYAEL